MYWRNKTQNSAVFLGGRNGSKSLQLILVAHRFLWNRNLFTNFNSFGIGQLIGVNNPFHF